MVFIVLIALSLLFMAQIALGQVPDIIATKTAMAVATETVAEIALLPDCYNVEEVFMTWGWFGKVATAVIVGLAALRPISQGLLQVSTLLGPRAIIAARVLYGLGQAAGMFCVSKPKFAEKFEKPTKAEPQPEPPKPV